MQIARHHAHRRKCVYNCISGGRTSLERPVGGLEAAALHGGNLQDHRNSTGTSNAMAKRCMSANTCFLFMVKLKVIARCKYFGALSTWHQHAAGILHQCERRNRYSSNKGNWLIKKSRIKTSNEVRYGSFIMNKTLLSWSFYFTSSKSIHYIYQRLAWTCCKYHANPKISIHKQPQLCVAKVQFFAENNERKT